MKVNIKKIHGPWEDGVSLDKHALGSVYTGDNEYGHPTFDTTRTEVGECLYQLKYRHDFNQVPIIAHEIYMAVSLAFQFISFIIPIPPSQYRSRQPVVEVSRKVAANLGVPCIENMLLKKAHTEQMKNISTRDEKVKALCDKLYFEDVVADGQYDVLIIDDLYDSGATLEAAAIVLRNYPKIRNIYVATIGLDHGIGQPRDAISSRDGISRGHASRVARPMIQAQQSRGSIDGKSVYIRLNADQAS